MTKMAACVFALPVTEQLPKMITADGPFWKQKLYSTDCPIGNIKYCILQIVQSGNEKKHCILQIVQSGNQTLYSADCPV